ncbi:hypothetical protein EBZ80_27060 [bacterium]|nr:hypothetical protein [bacterium]
MISLVPITFRKACEYIDLHHRHHGRPQGWLFGVGVEAGGVLVGISCVGRPVARMLDDGRTCEITRLCTDGTKNAPSMLYGASARAARALGYRRILTYTLASESGVSLRASGWIDEGEAGGGSWSRPSRRRIDSAPTETKRRWSLALHGKGGNA